MVMVGSEVRDGRPRPSVSEMAVALSALLSLPLLLLAPRVDQLLGANPFGSISPYCRWAAEVQLASFLTVTMLLFRHTVMETNAWQEGGWRSAPKAVRQNGWPVFAFVTAIIAVFLVDDVLAQAAFGHRLTGAPSDSGLSEFFKETVRAAIFGAESSALSRMPSGFALRQWIFLLVAAVVVAARSERGLAGWAAVVGLMVAFGYVAVARVSVGAHLPVDIVVSIGIGTLLFMTVIAGVAYRGRWENLDRLLTYLGAYGFIACGVFALVSNNSGFWIWAFIGLGFLLSVLARRVERPVEPVV